MILCASEYDTGPTYQPAPPSGEYNGLFTSDSLCADRVRAVPHVYKYWRGRKWGRSFIGSMRLSMGGCTGSIRSKNTTGSADPAKRNLPRESPALLPCTAKSAHAGKTRNASHRAVCPARHGAPVRIELTIIARFWEWVFFLQFAGIGDTV